MPGPVRFRRWRSFLVTPDEHERDSPSERASETACNAVEVNHSRTPQRMCTARLARIRRQMEEVVQNIGTLHFDGRRSDMHV